MSNSNTTLCPECGTEQPDTAPFCQDCGYRMRSPKTVREPAVSVSPGDDGPETDAAADRDGSGADESPSPPGRNPGGRQSGGRPGRQMVPTSGDEAGDQTGSGSQAGTPSPQSPVDASSDTIVEGMRAVSADDDHGGDESADGTEGATESPKSSPDSDAHSARDHQGATSPIEAQRTRIRWIVGGTVTACIAVVTGLTLLHIDRGEAADEQQQQVGVDHEVIEIDEGRFRRGLAEDAEAFILEFCYRYHDDPERDCARDRLLEGEYPEQTVEMPAYRIDSIPVRNSDYQACVEDEACEPIAWDDCDVWTPKGLQVGLRAPDILRRGDRPVVCVDHDRAADYCQWRGGALPTHNQWERAARGDTSPLFPWGNRWEPDRANWGEMDVMQTAVAGEIDGFAWTSPPGAFPDGKSAHGLYDMAGNVAEWTRVDDEALSAEVRGGSWVSNPFELRSTGREEHDVDAVRSDIGFRCSYPAGE